MKKTIQYSAFAIVAILCVSCSKQNLEANVPEMKTISFTAGLEESKTVLDGKQVKWENLDAVCIWDGTKQNIFTLTKAATGSFDGEITAESTDFCAYYPEIEVNQLQDGSRVNAVLKTADENPTFTTFLPSFQRVRDNSISQGALLAACKPTLEGDKLSGNMQIMCGFLKFSIGDAENSKVAKVRFTGKSKYLSGRCNLIFGKAKDGIADSLYVEAKNENLYVECAPETGEYFQNGTYYVAVLPYNNMGMTITVTTLDGKVYEYDNGQGWVRHGRNQIAYLGQVDSKVVEDGGLSSKLSILVDFVNGNASGYPSTHSQGDKTMTVSANGTTYSMVTNNLYGTTGALMINGTSARKAYVNTPAIPGRTLKEVVVTWVGEKVNNGNGMWIKDDSNSYTGKYFTNKGIDGTTKKTYAIPVIGGNNKAPFRVSHLFVLGKVSKGENSQTISTSLAENKSYSIYQGENVAAKVEQIQLIYE